MSEAENKIKLENISNEIIQKEAEIKKIDAEIKNQKQELEIIKNKFENEKSKLKQARNNCAKHLYYLKNVKKDILEIALKNFIIFAENKEIDFSDLQQDFKESFNLIQSSDLGVFDVDADFDSLTDCSNSSLSIFGQYEEILSYEDISFSDITNPSELFNKVVSRFKFSEIEREIKKKEFQLLSIDDEINRKNNHINKIKETITESSKKLPITKQAILSLSNISKEAGNAARIFIELSGYLNMGLQILQLAINNEQENLSEKIKIIIEINTDLAQLLKKAVVDILIIDKKANLIDGDIDKLIEIKNQSENLIKLALEKTNAN